MMIAAAVIALCGATVLACIAAPAAAASGKN